MTISAQIKRNNWEARLERINSGQTYTQTAAAEGTIPLRAARSSMKSTGLRGLSAWMLGGALGWAVGMMGAVLNPAAIFAERVALPEPLIDVAPLIVSWGNPVLALCFFLLMATFLRLRGALPRLIGLLAMAYVFALHMNADTPTIAELIGMAQDFLTNEEAIAGAMDAVRDWALQKKA